MRKILFVDDEKELHPVVMAYFPKDQFRVICAADGLEGLQKCRNEDFDLILLDFRMPKMDGVKFYQQLRDMQETKKAEKTPVIFISGFVDEVKAKNLNWERCEFLNKPFDKDELQRAMQKLKDDKTKIKPDSKIILNPGDKLFEEGDEADCIYYVVSGVLESFKKTTSMGKIGAGELLGEISVITAEKRLQTIVAIERTELITISSEKVLGIVEGQPKWIKLMLQNMSRRLSDAIKRTA